MVTISFDIEELAKLVENRNIPIKVAVLEYIDEWLYDNVNILWELQEKLQSNEELFRCIECGYWLDDSERSPEAGEKCVECYEEELEVE